MRNDSVTHSRRSIRLAGYDYSQAGAYFVTVVSAGRLSIFGNIHDGMIELNQLGDMVSAVWSRMPDYHNVTLDEWIVMPNHFHAILFIGRGEASGNDLAYPQPTIQPDASPALQAGTHPGSLGAIIQNFKSVSTRHAHTLLEFTKKTLWQRNYYEHIIRNENALSRLREYIVNNPRRWALDEENPSNSV